MQNPSSFRPRSWFTASLSVLPLLFSIGAASAKPGFQELLYNPKWYRTFDTSSSIVPAQGTLLFAWRFEDAAKAKDSFYVGIDTLWGLPQDVTGDTAMDWDLQVCPDEICMNGLKADVHGANAPYPFDDTNFQAEHHFQFFPAVDAGFNFVSPSRSIYGALMYCRSRTTGAADTVFAFGAWGLRWDPSALPPVRPVDGYLPRRSDFSISDDVVRYDKAGSGMGVPPSRGRVVASRLRCLPSAGGIRFDFPGIAAEKSIAVFSMDGRKIWDSGRLAAGISDAEWDGRAAGGGKPSAGTLWVRLDWNGGWAWAKAVRLDR
jgi:hypothetical protein